MADYRHLHAQLQEKEQAAMRARDDALHKKEQSEILYKAQNDAQDKQVNYWTERAHKAEKELNERPMRAEIEGKKEVEEMRLHVKQLQDDLKEKNGKVEELKTRLAAQEQ